MANSRKLGVLLSYGGNLLLVAVNIFLTPFLVSKLGDAEYGVYQMMASFAGYLVLMNFGTGTVMTRYVSVYLGKKDKEGERNFIAMGLIISGVLMVLIAAVSSVMYIFLEDIYSTSLNAQQIEKAKLLFAVVSVNVMVTLITQAFRGIVVAYEKFSVTNGYNILKILLKAGLIVLLFSIRVDSLVIVCVDLFLEILHFIVCFIYSQFVLRATPKLIRFDKAVFVSAALFAFAMMLQTVVNLVNTRVDITILGIMIGPRSVTVYSVAVQLFTVFSSVSTAAISVFLPKFSKLVAEGMADGDSLTREMIAPSRLQTLLSGTILFGVLACGRDFIKVWVGDGYSDAWIIALIIMVPTFLVYSNSVVESVLDALQKRLVRSVVLFCVALANIVLSIVLVHFFGELGAPIGTAVATMVGSLIIMNIYYSKAIGIRVMFLFKESFKGIIPALILAYLITLPVSVLVPVSFWGLLIKGTMFVLILVIMLILFGLNKSEKKMIKSLFERK